MLYEPRISKLRTQQMSSVQKDKRKKDLINTSENTFQMHSKRDTQQLIKKVIKTKEC